MGMTGAALLAASAALHGGAGRVLLSLLDAGETHTASQPELMLRRFDRLELPALTVVCGCGGGDAVAAVLPAVLHGAARLVLDADALNVIAADPALQAALRQRAVPARPPCSRPTRWKPRACWAPPRPRCSRAACAPPPLAQRFACTVVLKGSGTVIATPGQVPRINPTGNARLATAGTGDVLAGLLGARLAAGQAAP
jgi:NAD(P)H-hydrate repair Nnr-like enzyme with NAD(P)H-hydrate dehydratase domain